MIATVAKRLGNIEALVQQLLASNPPGAEANPVLRLLRQDPCRLMTLAGMEPDPWQQRLLCSTSPRMLLLCSRQAGKSTAVASLALQEALLKEGSLILLLSPSQRQSAELFKKLTELFNALGRPVKATSESVLRMELANGSRIIALPGDEATIRGYSGVRLVVVDEAARVPDSLYYSIRPMVAVSQGRFVVLSTPFGKRGFFYEAWMHPHGWEPIRIDATQRPRISPEFLAGERRDLGERWFNQEYLCSFEDVVGAVFSQADIDAAMSDELEPWVIN